jgi:hypothetical protein
MLYHHEPDDFENDYDHLDNERLLREEPDDDAESFARSSEEGWFSDDDGGKSIFD